MTEECKLPWPSGHQTLLYPVLCTHPTQSSKSPCLVLHHHPTWCSKAEHLSLQSTWKLDFLLLIFANCSQLFYLISNIFHTIFWSIGSEATLWEAEGPPLGKPAGPLHYLSPALAEVPSASPAVSPSAGHCNTHCNSGAPHLCASGMLLLKAG